VIRVETFKLPTLTDTSFFFVKVLRSIMRPPMLSYDVIVGDSKRIMKELDVPAVILGIQIRIKRLLSGLKHINLKKLLMPFVSSLEEKQTATVSKRQLSENKRLVDTDFVHFT
jgi:DNA polymerase-3 subunit alpha